jgi:LPS-assembly lipoprotein
MAVRCGIGRGIALAVGLVATSCGFHPLYAPSGTTNAQLSQIFVAVIPNRDGQLLRQSLQEHLDGSEETEKRYILTVSYSLQAAVEGVQADSSITRTRYIGTAQWVLKTPGLLGKTITSGFAQSLDGVNAINSQFLYGDLQSDAIYRRLSDALANRISEELAAYFRSHGTPAAA